MLESSELFDPKSALGQNSEPFTGIASGPLSEDFLGAIAPGVHLRQPNALQNPEFITQELSPRETAIPEEFTRFFPESSRQSHSLRDPLETLEVQMLQVRMTDPPSPTDADSLTDYPPVLSVTRDRLTDWNGGDSHSTPPSLTGSPENP